MVGEDIKHSSNTASLASEKSQEMLQIFSKSIVLMGSSSNTKISYDEASSNPQRIQEMNQVLLELDGNLVQYFEKAAEIETLLGIIQETVDRNISEPSTTTIANSIDTALPLDSEEKRAITIDRLLQEITTMDKIIEKNDHVIDRQANILTGAYKHLENIHTFNDNFNTSILTLTPMQDQQDQGSQNSSPNTMNE